MAYFLLYIFLGILFFVAIIFFWKIRIFVGINNVQRRNTFEYKVNLMFFSLKYSLIDEKFVINIENVFELLEEYVRPSMLDKNEEVFRNSYNYADEKVFGNSYNREIEKKTKKVGLGILKNFQFLKGLSYESLAINVRIGLEDASITALFYGLLSIIFSTLSIFLIKGLNIKSTTIGIKPDFSQCIQQISIKCILKIKIADIIVLFLKNHK